MLAERARVATEGWGARLLALQGDDGQWDGGTYFPARVEDSEQGQPWTATTYSLLLLRDLGLDPRGDEARGAIALVRENSRWEEGDQPFFDGEVEPCINGMAVALGAYFGENVEGVVARLLGEQLADGGWNCDAERGSRRSSFGTTINVLEGLLEHERATGGSPASVRARRRGEQYLLERGLLRRRTTGELIDQAWLRVLVPDPLALRRPPRPRVLPSRRRRPGPTRCRGGRGAALEAAPRRHVAAREHPSRPHPFRHGRRRRTRESVEHPQGAAGAEVVRARSAFSSARPCTSTDDPPPPGHPLPLYPLLGTRGSPAARAGQGVALGSLLASGAEDSAADAEGLGSGAEDSVADAEPLGSVEASDVGPAVAVVGAADDPGAVPVGVGGWVRLSVGRR